MVRYALIHVVVSKTVYETACMQFYVNSTVWGWCVYTSPPNTIVQVCLHAFVTLIHSCGPHGLTEIHHMDSQALAHYAGLFCLLHRPISRRVYGLEFLSHTHAIVVMAEMSMFCWLLFSERR